MPRLVVSAVTQSKHLSPSLENISNHRDASARSLNLPINAMYRTSLILDSLSQKGIRNSVDAV
jgi:hypothetical protein